MRPAPSSRGGFTLAEVAVTLLIVAIGLVLVLQGLTSAKLSAAETHYRKVARELALLTLGRVEGGLFWEELDGGASNDGDMLTGTFAEEGHEDFSYELVFGEEEFREGSGRYDERQGYHDSWEYDREREERADERSSDEEDEDAVSEPFQKVRIKVRYPQLSESESALVLERWMTWEQVYGVEDGEESDAESTGGAE